MFHCHFVSVRVRVVQLVALFFCAALVCGASAACANEAKPYRVLVFPGSFDKPAEQHCYDAALAGLGAEYDYAGKRDFESGAVFNRLSEYDMILVPPSFHSRPAKIPEGQTYAQDMKRFAPQIKKWLSDGGIIIMHDCNYSNRLAWLADVDPSLALTASGCSYKGPKRVAEGVPETFFTIPMSLDYGVHWNHMVLPEGSAWKPLAVCASGNPVAAYCMYGKGLIFGMSVWQGDASAMIANVRAYAPLLASGLSVKSLVMPEPAVGENTFSVELSNHSDKAQKAAMSFAGKRVSAEIRPGATETLSLQAHISERGFRQMSLEIDCAGRNAVFFNKKVRLREIFELGSTLNRNLISMDRRYDDVLLRTFVSPDREDLTGAVVRLRVFSPDGKELSETETPAHPGAVQSRIKLVRGLPAGEYKVCGELVSSDGKVLGKDDGRVEIIPSEPGQSAIDEDLNLIVDGEPFFPLGIYHVKPEEFGEVSELGINMIQLFGWFWSSGLENAWRHGLRTVWAPHGGTPEQTVADYGGNPSLMMWYLLDEPAEKDIPRGREMNNAFHSADKQHLTFLCSCTPDKFDKFSALADVFAPDPYPHDWDTPDIVARWMDAAHGATDGDKVLICIPQSHLMETNPEWIAMTYLALCHRSRGVFWYCWSQQGGGPSGVGIKHNPEHLRDLPRITSELRALAPALLNAPSCEYFVSNGVHGVSCQDPSTLTRYMILVNPATNGAPLKASIAWQGADPAAAEARGAFGGRGFPMKNGVVEAVMHPLEVRTLYTDGPAPVAVTLPPPPTKPSGKGRELRVGRKREYKTIQAAVDAASPGDTIRVDPGTYEPFSTGNKYLLIRGEKGAGKTIVDGGMTNRAATLTAKPYGTMASETNTVLESLTLQGGAAAGSSFRKNYGGCVIGGTLRDCVVTGGSAQYGGGAAYSHIEDSTVKNCTASKMGGGIAFCTAEKSELQGNAAGYDGGGSAFSDLYACEILSNSAERDGGGARFGSAKRCIFRKNTAGRDGGGAKIDSGAVKSSLFDGNKAGRNGGGAQGTPVSLSTFVNNAAKSGGGVAGGLFIDQCIIWNNTAEEDPQTGSYFGDLNRVHNSCLQWNSTNALPPTCISSDPRFKRGGDYAIDKRSPCVDLGRGVCAPGELDLAGRPRRLGRETDAGCYEAGALPADKFLDKKAELFRLSAALKEAEAEESACADASGKAEKKDERKRESVFPFVHALKLPEKRETTDLRIYCRFRCEKNRRGVIARFESDSGMALELSVNQRDGRLFGVLVYDAVLGTSSSKGEPGRRRVKCSPSGVAVDDGKWHEAEIIVRGLNVDAAVTELTLDGKEMPPEFPWFRESSDAVRIRDGRVIAGGSISGEKKTAFGGEVSEVVVEALPSTNI